MPESANERRHPLTDDDINRIADAIASRAREAFHIDDKKHYDSHQRLDRLLDVYDGATSIFIKTFLGLVIIGMIVLAGVTSVKGWK